MLIAQTANSWTRDCDDGSDFANGIHALNFLGKRFTNQRTNRKSFKQHVPVIATVGLLYYCNTQ